MYAIRSYYGRVGPTTAFLLLQQAARGLALPWWVRGAWGPDSAAAAWTAGARGVVLGEELWLASESPLSEAQRQRFASLDGSETVCLAAGTHEA